MPLQTWRARLRREITSPLARYGSTALAVLALAGGLGGAALAAGLTALICWTTRPPRTRRTR